MQSFTTYSSPLGQMTLAADEQGLVGVWFDGQRSYAVQLDPAAINQETPLLIDVIHWLERYFAGEVMTCTLPIHFVGTPFQRDVWAELTKIPYGQTISYKAIALAIATKRGGRMCAQAVGQAVGRNPISILVPCHRVVGAKGQLTGYAGGIDKKIALLKLEGALK